MSNTSRPSTTRIRQSNRPRGDRPSRKERGFCTHGVPKSQCKKTHAEDGGSAMAGGAMT